jgi:parallel beta-helix repeat protein
MTMKKTDLLLPLALLLTALPCAAQGPLAPPGPPAPTMKTLEQIEPRTPIYSAPYAITQPGSYYLVSNLHSTTDGIFIQISGVTLDLMGFSLTGDGGQGDDGITVAATYGMGTPINNVVIKGGRISRFGRGLLCKYMNNSRLERLEVSDNTGPGISLDGSGANGKCNGNTVAHCTISGNGSVGIGLAGSVGQCNGNTLTDCTIIGNDVGGAYFSASSSGQCNYNTVAHCTFSDNGTQGIYLSGLGSGECNGNSLVDSTFSSNTSYGVWFDGTSGKCNGNTLARCTVSGNADHGIFLYLTTTGECSGNTIRENTISENAGRGLYAYKANGNRIEANNIWGTTTYGISTESTTDNFILQNTCVGYATNFSLSANDTYVPVVPASPAPQPVDPRTPISSAPYAITQPGSYYLVSNLHSTNHGIEVQTSGVTLDLNGFSITGDGGTSDYGITVETHIAIDKVTIGGGTISGFGAGLQCKNMNNSQIKDLVVSDNKYGIFFSGSNSGACNGNSLTDCIISENDEWGLRLFGTQGECNGNRITGCTISGNGSYGVWLYNGTGGQCDGNLLQGNQVIMNTDRGIYLQGANGNRIEANNIWGTSGGPSYGIQTIGNTNNFILRNTCVGQTSNFSLSADDTYGPEVTVSGALSSTGDESHPWANFSR